MFEWKLADPEEPRPPAEQLPPTWGAARRRVWLAVGWGFFIVLVSVLAFHIRLDASREEMRLDLIAQIEIEERARAFGLDELFETLVSSRAERWWLNDFRLRFSEGALRGPVTHEVSRVEWREGGALVTVSIDGHPQLRYYTMEQGTWRRAPITDRAWGATDRRLTAGGIDLRYAARDEHFARSLAPLLETLAAMALEVDRPLPYTRIEIRGLEHSGRAAWAETDTLYLFSPLVLEATEISPEERVREAVVRRHVAALDRSGRTGSWPGRDANAAALADVLASRLALSSEAHGRRLRRWLMAREGRWNSPFGPMWADAWGESRLVADRLFEQAGPESLAALLAAAPEWDVWQAEIERRTGATSYALEVEAFFPQRPFDSPATLPDPPVVGVARGTGHRDLLLLDVPGIYGPIEIDAGGHPLVLADGSEVQPGCAPLYGEIQVAGDWRGGRRLEANRLSSERQLPVAPYAAPVPYPGAIAEVLVDDRELITVYPQGRTWPWLTTGEGQLLLTSVDPGEDVTFLMTDAPPGCDTALFYEVDPLSHRVNRSWRVVDSQPGLHPPRWVMARADRGDWLFAVPRSQRRLEYFRLVETSPETAHESPLPLVYPLSWLEATLEPVRSSTLPFGRPLGWREATQEVVTHNWLQGSIDLVTLGGERPRSFPIPDPRIHNLRLVEDGRGVIFSTSGPPDDPGARAIDYLDLESGERRELYRSPVGRRLGPGNLHFVVREDGGDLLLTESTRVHTWLLAVDVRTGVPVEIARLAAGESLRGAVACRDGGLLYALGSGSREGTPQTRLVRWQPPGTSTTLIEMDGSVRPVRCLA